MNCSSDKCLIYRYLMTGYIGQVSSIQGLKQIATPPTAPKCPLLAFAPSSCLLWLYQPRQPTMINYGYSKQAPDVD